MTYIDLVTYITGQHKKSLEDMQKLVMQAWYTAAWQRTKTMSELKDVLEDLKESTEENTDDKLWRNITGLQHGTGGVN